MAEERETSHLQVAATVLPWLEEVVVVVVVVMEERGGGWARKGRREGWNSPRGRRTAVERQRECKLTSTSAQVVYTAINLQLHIAYKGMTDLINSHSQLRGS